MRIAIVSDIHGNLTAFEAVLADLRETAPDLVLHGGDLADAGTSPAEVVDQMRSLGWQGVAGNGEEALTVAMVGCPRNDGVDPPVSRRRPSRLACPRAGSAGRRVERAMCRSVDSVRYRAATVTEGFLPSAA